MRSPLLGYNHNVKYGGRVFHVQTEDSGPVNPHIFTHLFYAGSILASMRESYDPETSEDKVRAIMQTQHKAILKQLKNSAFEERIVAFFASRGEVFRLAEETLPPASSASAEMPAASAPEMAKQEPVLDLDSLPTSPSEPGHTPEPLPGHVNKPAVPGPGSYTLRRPLHDRVDPTPPPLLAKPRPAARPAPARSPTPVIVQRQVVVGTSPQATGSTRKPATTPVRRRPVSGGPYIVKEGSHVTAVSPPAAHRSVPPPAPIAPLEEIREAPRTATSTSGPIPVDHGSDPGSAALAPGGLVSEQSLDDVILAYLSQGERKP